MKPLKLFLIAIMLIIGIYTVSSNTRTSEAHSLSIDDSSLYLRSNYPPFTIESHILGSLIGIERIIKQANLTPNDELNRIIWYESNNNHLAQNPYSSAYGYCQIILSTRALIEKQIGNIDWQSPEEQLEACEWLYLNHNPSREWAETEYLWK